MKTSKNKRKSNQKKLSRYERKLIRQDIRAWSGNMYGISCGGFIPKAAIGGAK